MDLGQGKVCEHLWLGLRACLWLVHSAHLSLKHTWTGVEVEEDAQVSPGTRVCTAFKKKVAFLDHNSLALWAGGFWDLLCRRGTFPSSALKKDRRGGGGVRGHIHPVCMKATRTQSLRDLLRHKHFPQVGALIAT